jgi:hypothetical protein
MRADPADIGPETTLEGASVCRTEASGLAQGDKTAIELLLSAVPCVAL